MCRKIRRRAALFVALRIICDQPERDTVARLVEHLSAQQITVAVVDITAAHHVFQEPVAFQVDAVEPHRDRIGKAARGAQLTAAKIIIARSQLARDFGIELGLGGDD